MEPNDENDLTGRVVPESSEPAQPVEFVCSICKLPIVWISALHRWYHFHEGGMPDGMPDHPATYGSVGVAPDQDSQWQQSDPAPEHRGNISYIYVTSNDGPLTVVSKMYHLDDPHQRREYEMDTNARKWAAAVFKVWERLGDERDKFERLADDEKDGGYKALYRARAFVCQRAIEILNEELESRGLDLEASCG